MSRTNCFEETCLLEVEK